MVPLVWSPIRGAEGHVTVNRERWQMKIIVDDPKPIRKPAPDTIYVRPTLHPDLVRKIHAALDRAEGSPDQVKADEEK